MATAQTGTDWPEFEGALAVALEALEDGQSLVLDVAAPSRYYVQFADNGDRGLWAEAVGNAFLDGDTRLDEAAVAHLGRLGWHSPVAGSTDGTRNFHLAWRPPVPYDEVADLVATTLREVYRVGEPGDLRYQALGRDSERLALPLYGVAESTDKAPAAADAARDESAPPESLPTADGLKAEVKSAVRQMLGTEQVHYDDDGNIPFREGSAAVFVRVIGDPAWVQVFSPMLADVPETPELLEAVNGINREIAFGRVLWTGEEVVAVIDLFAGPFVPAHLFHAYVVLSRLADDYDHDLQERFGGRTFFGARVDPPHFEASAGYL